MPKHRVTRRRLLAAAAPVVAATPFAKLALAAGDHAEHAGMSMAAIDHAAMGHAAMIGSDALAPGGPNERDALLYPPAALGHRPGRVREYAVAAVDRQIEVAKGVFFSAWTYNGTVPGPVIRATEGDLLRVRFTNGGSHPHTIHFHGIHPATMDGVPGLGAGQIEPGGSTVYEFDALPAGLHLYHCHVRPLAEHIAKGLYGAFIIDPAEPREDADELVMVMNGFDTNFDRANEVYAANTIGFAYMDRPIQARLNELVRVYVVNVLEYDLINSFHLHGNLFDYFPTGTSRTASELTDTVMLCQGQRGILQWRFAHPGKYMFHAHQSEFTELGWQGFFEVA